MRADQFDGIILHSMGFTPDLVQFHFSNCIKSQYIYRLDSFTFDLIHSISGWAWSPHCGVGWQEHVQVQKWLSFWRFTTYVQSLYMPHVYMGVVCGILQASSGNGSHLSDLTPLATPPPWSLTKRESPYFSDPRSDPDSSALCHVPLFSSEADTALVAMSNAEVNEVAQVRGEWAGRR